MKKIVILLLAALLLVQIGCSAGNTSENSPTTPPGDTTANEAATNGQEVEAPLEFSISIRTGNLAHVVNSPNINEDRWVKELNARTNVKLDIRLMPHGEFVDKMIQMFATNDIPDVVSAGGGVFANELAGSVEAGIYIPLDDLLAEYGQDLLNKIPESAWQQVTYQGQIMGIPEWISNPARRATVIRTDLLEQTGLDIPQTVDEYLEVLRAFKKLGVPQPFGARTNLTYADVFYGAYDVLPHMPSFRVVDDELHLKFMDIENMQAAIGVYRTMFEEELMSREFATINATQYKNAIVAGDIGIWNMNANELIAWTKLLQENVPTATTKIIPAPIGPDGKGGQHLVGSTLRTYYLNKDMDREKAIRIIKFFNWMVSEEAEMFFSLGIEGENYTIENGEIKYNFPTDQAGIDEEFYRTGFLWLVQDGTYNKRMLSLTEEGRALMEVYDTILMNEGRSGIQFNPPLESLQINPDITPAGTPPTLLNEHIMRMIFGQEDISNWPNVIADWRARGGDQIIKEATERYNNNDGVIQPPR